MNRGNRRRKTKPWFGSLSFSIQGNRGLTGNESVRRSAMVKKEHIPQAPTAFLFVFVVLCILVTSGLIYHLNLRFEGVWLGYETSRARAERAQLVAERRELRLELSSLKAPERIETEAREKLGMEMPAMDQIVPMEKKMTPVLASGRAR